MTRDDVEELLRRLLDGETNYIDVSRQLWPGQYPDESILIVNAVVAYDHWLAVESDPDAYCDPAATWQCDERQKVKDRARCDLMDAIDRLIEERAA